MRHTSFTLRPFAGAVLLALLPGLALAQQNTTYQYQYDAVGNLTQITDPLQRVTTQSYDALNRLKQQLQPAPVAGAARPVIGYAYDGQDQLVSVTDPRTLVTTYQIDGLGNQTAIVSPDTGTTRKTVDAAGNMLTSTDAKGQTTAYQYDALNRITRITYAGGQVVNYAYDQGTHGIGRLTQISDASGTIAYAYDQHGRRTSETRTINSIPYVTTHTYDGAGRLATTTYPSGRSIAYSRDGLGRISAIASAKDGDTVQIVHSIAYQPFGGITSYVNGAGATMQRSHDLDGRITSYMLGGQPQTLTYDAASRITLLWDTGNVAHTHQYGYDDLDRLTQYTGPVSNQSFGYDAVGNRTQQQLGSTNTSYQYGAASNRLTQIAGSQTLAYQSDANGSVVHNGLNQFSYDTRGRMTNAVTALGHVAYTVNALGQRIAKALPNSSTHYHYDGNGQLIGESTAQGVFQKEYVYLNDMPVALFQ